MLTARVDAHHNVEDFRPYKIKFKDKGSEEANRIHGLCLAIRREADWNGWFEPDMELEGTTIKAIWDAVRTGFAPGDTEIEINISTFERSAENDEIIGRKDSVFSVWSILDTHDPKNPYWNTGFGMGIMTRGRVDTDKYDNKWVTIS